MKIFIKNMVCIRCKMAVESELEKLGLRHTSITLGEVIVERSLTVDETALLKTALWASGLELLDDKRSLIVERIKNIIIEMVHYSDELPKINFSAFISNKSGYDYTYLSNLFSEVQGMTIEQFIIIHKIERVKELLTYDELNLTEIAVLMQYSSAAHLANQFKKITGLTSKHFKAIQGRRRKGLEEM